MRVDGTTESLQTATWARSVDGVLDATGLQPPGVLGVLGAEEAILPRRAGGTHQQTRSTPSFCSCTTSGACDLAVRVHQQHRLRPAPAEIGQVALHLVGVHLGHVGQMLAISSACDWSGRCAIQSL